MGVLIVGFLERMKRVIEEMESCYILRGTDVM